MNAIPDVALRDADRWADEEGRRVAHDEYVDTLVDGMLDDVDEVTDLIRFGDSSVLARALAERSQAERTSRTLEARSAREVKGASSSDPDTGPGVACRD